MIALRTLLSLATAALVAVAAYAGDPFLLAAVGLLVVGTAAGWATLLDLPHPRGTGVVVALAGLAAAGAAVADRTRDAPLAAFGIVLALAVLVAFVHELLRRDGRADLVESLTGTFSGEVVVVLGSGGEGRMVALYRSGDRLSGVLAISQPAKLMGYRPLLAAGASFDEALAHASS